jgi:hypothetical protein
MNEPSGIRRSMPSLGVVLLIVAGALFIVGTFVPAASVDIQGQASSSASLWDEDWEGWASLIVGIVLLLGAAWVLMARRDVRAAGWAFAVLGLAGAALAIYKIVNIESEAVNEIAAQTAAQQGVPAEAARPAIQQLFDSGAASVTVTTGLWIVVIAGVVALVAGILLAMARRAEPAMMQEPMRSRIG